MRRTRSPQMHDTSVCLTPDSSVRILTLIDSPGDSLNADGTARIQALADRVAGLDTKQTLDAYQQTIDRYNDRHSRLGEQLDATHDDAVNGIQDHCTTLTQRRLHAAYLTCEYTIETSGLFNPSLALMNGQEEAETGQNRDYLLSLRAVGERHKSTLELATLTSDGYAAHLHARQHRTIQGEVITDGKQATITFPKERDTAIRVITGFNQLTLHGLEDARLTRRTRLDGSNQIEGTYTGYDGHTVTLMHVETRDEDTWHTWPLEGEGAQNKGLAYFPELIDGRYAALSRWDQESNTLAYSEDGLTYSKGPKLQYPTSYWNTRQQGNSGSPIATPDGWLTLIHGVGPMREYHIGAILLDKLRPEKVIAYLENPLISPQETTREGYVPNVVYTCGGALHGDRLILPYALNDQETRVATLDLAELISSMTPLH